MKTFGPKPSNYGGFWPDPDDILVLTRHRESSILDQSNFEVAQERLGNSEHVILFRTRHWAVGWIEYLGIRKSAPGHFRQEATKIAEELESCPVLDEDHYTELCTQAADEVWQGLSKDERLDYLQEVDLDPSFCEDEICPTDLYDILGIF